MYNKLNRNIMRLIGNDLYADEGKWLYQDSGENQRDFWKSVTLCDVKYADTFNECTDAEKEEWKREHEEPEPEPADE